MLKRYSVHLPDDERHRLEQLVRAGKHTARVLAQVRILLKADEGWLAVRISATWRRRPPSDGAMPASCQSQGQWMVGDREAMTMERIELRPETELRDVVERVREDKIPRLIERDGVPLAVVVSPEQFEVAHEPTSKRRKERLLALAGVWSDLDADHMIEELYKRRGEAPPGRSVNGEARTENAT